MPDDIEVSTPGQETRSSRRSALIAIVVPLLAIFIVASVFFVLDGRPARPGPVAKAGSSLPASTSTLAPPSLRPYSIFYEDPEGSRVVPLDGSQPTVVLSGAGYPEAPLGVVGGVAFIHAGSAYFLPDSAPGQLRVLGAADLLIPALGGGELVGLVSGIAPMVVQFVNILHGPSPIPPPVQLPTGYQPIAQVDAGILVHGSNGEIRVWMTRTRTVGPLIGTTNFAVITHGDQVAWRSATGCNTDAECPLHLTDTSSGADRVVGPPPGHGVFLAGGAFSPDGRLYAGFVSAPTGSGPQAQLVVVDLGPSIPVLINDSVVPVGEAIGSAAWAPDGSAVFFGGLNGPLHAAATGSAQAITLGVPSSYSFTVF